MSDLFYRRLARAFIWLAVPAPLYVWVVVWLILRLPA